MTTLIKYKNFCQRNKLKESQFKNFKYYMEVKRNEH